MANGLSRRQAERDGLEIRHHLRLIDGDLDDQDERQLRMERKINQVLVLVAGVFTELLVGLAIFALTR